MFYTAESNVYIWEQGFLALASLYTAFLNISLNQLADRE